MSGKGLALFTNIHFKKKRFVALKNVMITHPICLEHFLPSNLLNNYQLYMLKQPWMCKVNVGLHKSDAMKLVIRPFWHINVTQKQRPLFPNTLHINVMQR
jgi:hypothetical protein